MVTDFCDLSQEADESESLLNESQTPRYGGLGEDEVAQPDEEELEREREALNRITMLATEYVFHTGVDGHGNELVERNRNTTTPSARPNNCQNDLLILPPRSMIDVSHPNAVSINQHMTAQNSLRGKPTAVPSQETEANAEAGSESTITSTHNNHSNGNEEAEEQAWLDSITSTEAGSVTHIKPLQKGALVMDIGQLREGGATMGSSVRKASRAGVGRG